MRINKKFLFIIFIFFQIISFSNKLVDISYRNGEFILEFEKSISKPSISNNKISSGNNINYNVAQIFIDNVKIDEKVLRNINIDDLYYKYIIVDNISKDKIGIFAYSQYGYDSSVSYNKNIVKIRSKSIAVPKRISPLTNKPLTIVLDAGHGGHDSGARGHGKLEKDIALEVVLKLEKNLSRDHKVILTRRDDTFITLSDRPNIGNKNNADLFISVHLNAATNPKAHGAEIFYFSKETNPYTKKLIESEEKYDEIHAKKVSLINQILGDFFVNRTKEKSANLADIILNNYVDKIGLKRRGIFGANFAVLRGSESASILIELGFITNENDIAVLSSESGQILAVNAIADSIRENFEE